MTPVPSTMTVSLFMAVIALIIFRVNAGADLLSQSQFDEMFSKRGTADSCAQATKLLTYEAFIKAAKYYPKFANEGSKDVQKRELAAFLGQISQETTGWWEGQPYAWGLCFVEEVACKDQPNGCPQYTQPGNEQYPAVDGVSYHGRGAMQITWNYNYGRVSEVLYGDKNVLLRHPEKLLKSGVTAFRASIDFWMTPVDHKPSCHDVMIGKADECPSLGRLNGYGMTTNIINGGLECMVPTSQKVKNRVEYYKRYCSILDVSPGKNLYCDDMTHYAMYGECPK
eukprot:CFRG7203T1